MIALMSQSVILTELTGNIGTGRKCQYGIYSSTVVGVTSAATAVLTIYTYGKYIYKIIYT